MYNRYRYIFAVIFIILLLVIYEKQLTMGWRLIVIVDYFLSGPVGGFATFAPPGCHRLFCEKRANKAGKTFESL